MTTDDRTRQVMRLWALAQPTVSAFIIFTSDNGGTQQDTAPLNGSKGQLYEGGIRVPLVVTGPTVTRKGATSDMPVASIEIYPTLLELAGVRPPPGHVLDGVSWAAVLAGARPPHRPRLPIVCRAPGHMPPCGAVRPRVRWL